MGLRDEKKTAMRNAILETALALFRTVGFERTRVQDVVSQLKISEATFFNYFPSKQAVLEAAAQNMLCRSLELLRDELGDESRPIEERLERLARRFASDFAEDPGIAAFLASHARFRLVASDRVNEAHEILTRLFAEGQARGEVRDDLPPAQLTDIQLGISFVAISAWINDGSPVETLEERLLTAHRVFWAGAHSQNSNAAAAS
jgi:AcrR family transcriptional regulator